MATKLAKTALNIPTTLRVVESQDAKYALVGDRMCFLKETTGTDGIRHIALREPSLSRSVVKNIFKKKEGFTRRWRFLLGSNGRLAIGCQVFDGTAVKALKEWAGITG